MKRTNQLQTATKGVNRWLKAGSRTLPVLGAAMLFGMATPTLADSKVSFHVSQANAQQRAHPGRTLERKLNRVARTVSRELNVLQPVSHRDRGSRHERNQHIRHDRHVRRDHRQADRYRANRQYQRQHHANTSRVDPLYQPMSYRRWSRYQHRITHDARYVTPRNYQRYLKKYRKHYRHGHAQPYIAGVDRHGRGHKRGRH